MTFIGIVIFTVYSQFPVYHSACDPKQIIPGTACPDKVLGAIAKSADEHPQYFGEFKTVGACDAAAWKVHYRLKKYETRVDKIYEVLCVPKDLK